MSATENVKDVDSEGNEFLSCSDHASEHDMPALEKIGSPLKGGDSDNWESDASDV